MKSSSLNEHLYIKILLIIIIVCVKRVNLHKIIYLNVRNILINEIVFIETRKLFQLLNIRPSENLLLLGSPDLDIDSNIIVFTTVHKYISESKRFS
jgi:hypothetical protein